MFQIVRTFEAVFSKSSRKQESRVPFDPTTQREITGTVLNQDIIQLVAGTIGCLKSGKVIRFPVEFESDMPSPRRPVSGESS